MIRFNLIKLRGEKTQQQVSDEMGISRLTYKNWELGKTPKEPMLIKLSEHFKITIEELCK